MRTVTGSRYGGYGTHAMLTSACPRAYPLRHHPVQVAYSMSTHRFNVVPAARRSGKTERLKRKMRRKMLTLEGITHNDTPQFFLGAPTRDQARRIFWDDMKSLLRPYLAGPPSESMLTLEVVTGARLTIVGMDKPERVEGTPWDGCGLDEYANMKERTWGFHVRPALADRNGWCDFTGVPEGRNHYYALYQRAMADMMTFGAASEWGAYTWVSADILPASEIAAAMRDLDEDTFNQEYRGSFINFTGRAYKQFTEDNKLPVRKLYRPDQPLHIMFDFNVAPGVAVVAQELVLRTLGHTRPVTCVIGEVWIDNNSDTNMVCRKLLTDWQPAHQADVYVYGDATGGARGAAKVAGSDWDLVKAMFRNGDSSRGVQGFGHRVHYRVPAANPAERARVNAMNTRLCNRTGERRLYVDPRAAPYTVRDLDGVVVVKGGSGEIDKKKAPTLTHISDALGYYVVHQFPIQHSGVHNTTLSV